VNLQDQNLQVNLQDQNLGKIFASFFKKKKLDAGKNSTVLGL